MLLCLLFTDVVSGGGFYSPAFCAVSLIDVEGKVGGAYKQFSETIVSERTLVGESAFSARLLSSSGASRPTPPVTSGGM